MEVDRFRQLGVPCAAMTEAFMPSGRDYPRLFAAMDACVEAVFANTAKDQILRDSVAAAAEGFGAEKAVLLVVRQLDPWQGRTIWSLGVKDTEIASLESGVSVRGVSASILRQAVATRDAVLVEDPRHMLEPQATAALHGLRASVLAVPILDPATDQVLAVMYFQNRGFENAFAPSDVAFATSYARAIRRAFSLRLERERWGEERQALLDITARGGIALIGDSSHTLALRRELHEIWIPLAEISPAPPNILITGPTGTGKELIARYIHAYGARAKRPIIVVNCGGLTRELVRSELFGHVRGAFTGADRDKEGAVKAAHGGVLLLDEVGDLAGDVQSQLLRVLDTHEVQPLGSNVSLAVDTLIILATNADLDNAAATNTFKPDLLQRFQAQRIRLEPLRTRVADIRPLLRHYLQYHEQRTHRRTLGFHDEALRALITYSWPGNVRELSLTVEALVVRTKPGTLIDREVIARAAPAVLAPSSANPDPGAAAIALGDSYDRALESFQRDLVLAALERHNFRRRPAREQLGLSITRFHRLLHALGMGERTRNDPEDEEESA
jgi:DNA-binding NtrC family response regulator